MRSTGSRSWTRLSERAQSAQLMASASPGPSRAGVVVGSSVRSSHHLCVGAAEHERAQDALACDAVVEEAAWACAA